MKHIASLCLALAACAPVLAQERELFRDDFSGANAWTAADKPSTRYEIVGGRMRATNASKDFGTQVSRPVRMPASTAYRLSFSTTEVSSSGDNVYYGVALRAPDGDEVGFVISNDGFVRSYLWRDGKWAADPLTWRQVAAAKTGPGAANRIRIEREAGRFLFHVNDVLVGGTDVVDLVPSEVVLSVNQNVTVDFDDITLVATGQDSRFARMLLQQPVPGAAVLLQDDLSRTTAEALRGRMQGKDVRDVWSIGDNSERRAAIDYGRGLYVYESKDDKDHMAYGGGTVAPRPWAGWSMGAKVNYTRANKEGCGGLAAIGQITVKDASEPRILPCFRPDTGQAQIWYYPTDESGWRNLLDVKAVGLREGSNELRLVVNEGRLLLFYNGHYQGDAATPSDFRFESIGVHVDAQVGVEVDDIDCREI